MKNEWIVKLTDSAKFSRCALYGDFGCSQWDQSMQCAEDLERDTILKDRKIEYINFICQMVHTSTGFVRRALKKIDQAGMCMPCFGRAIFDILFLEDIIGRVERGELKIENEDPKLCSKETFANLCTHARREQSYGLATLSRECTGKVQWKEVVTLINFAEDLSRTGDDQLKPGNRFFTRCQEFTEDILRHREERVDPGKITELVMDSVSLETMSSLSLFVPKNKLPGKRTKKPRK
ncbi:MAG: hypothetical protein ACYCPO_09240 [Acidobacteriaceae bacterium]